MTDRGDKLEKAQWRTEAMVECGIDDTITDKQTTLLKKGIDQLDFHAGL